MAKFKAKWTINGRTFESSLPHNTEASAIADAQQYFPGSKVVVIVRDSEGEDHPENAGKYFLHKILK